LHPNIVGRKKNYTTNNFLCRQLQILKPNIMSGESQKLICISYVG